MTQKSLLKLMEKAENNGFVQLENGFKLVSKDWMIKNIKSSCVSKRLLARLLEDYEWREIDSSYMVQYLLENKTVKQPGFYLLDENNFVCSDSFNIDFPYDIETISGTRCYVLSYYSDDEFNIYYIGYKKKEEAEEIFNIYASYYDDVAVYTLKDDSSIDADNIDENAWSKIS